MNHNAPEIAMFAYAYYDNLPISKFLVILDSVSYIFQKKGVENLLFMQNSNLFNDVYKNKLL